MSTAIQEVPVTEKHCKDIFDLTGDTSHKPQVAMEQNLLHCIGIKVSDGLKGIVIFIALSIIFKCTKSYLFTHCYYAYKYCLQLQCLWFLDITICC